MTDQEMSLPEMVEHTNMEDVPHHTPLRTTQNATGFMIFFSFWIALSAWICSFDTGYGGIVLLMPSYNNAFGVCHTVPNGTGAMIEKCHVAATQQSLISLTSLFIALGGALSAPVGHYLGRRGTIQFGCVLVIIGAAGMLGTSGNFTNYMVCKCLGGVGLGHLYAASPMYGVECTSPKKRGMLMSLYNIGLAMGNVAALAVCAGSSNIQNDWAWKTPIICQIPLAVIFAIGIMIFPESPPWLLTKGKEEKARKSFGKFYQKDPNSDEITAQIREIFRRNDIRRTFTSALIFIGLTITGIQFVIPYAAIFLSGVGIQNPYLINVIIGLCIFAGTFPGPFIVEYGGRRFAMLAGYGGMSLCMLIFSAVSTGLGASTHAAKDVLVAFLCIWAFILGGFIGSSVWVASSEMHSVRLRTYGQACSTMFYSIFGFGASFWTPYMLNVNYGNMGTNVGYFYFGVTLLMFMLMFSFVPETARLTLEQIDDYFASGRPAWKTSTRRNKVIAKGDLHDVSPEVHDATIKSMGGKDMP